MLNARQRAFVAEYLKNGGNATQAAISAGYSNKCAHVIGPRLLGNVRVASEIEKKQAKSLAKHEITVDRVLTEYARLAFLDPAKFYGPDGELLPIQQMPEDARVALSGLESEELFAGRGKDRECVGTLRKIKFTQKTAALEVLAKHLGILKPFDGFEVPGFSIQIFLSPGTQLSEPADDLPAIDVTPNGASEDS